MAKSLTKLFGRLAARRRCKHLLLSSHARSVPDVAWRVSWRDGSCAEPVVGCSSELPEGFRSWAEGTAGGVGDGGGVCVTYKRWLCNARQAASNVSGGSLEVASMASVH